MHRFLVGALAALALTLLPASAATADVPQGGEWAEAYIDDGMGPVLQADVIRPKGLAATARTPVLMTVSPYVNHSGQTTDYDPEASGPTDRFDDFIEGAKVLQKGYTYVYVSLRGTGGSAGCTDWGGPGEQADVRRAVEWAAAQSWSTGKVGLYGKSYDGWTGLMGIAQRPHGLGAVVSQEPVYSGYRYLYTHGVRFSNSVATPAVFSALDAKPGSLNDSPDYHVNGNQSNLARPGCQALNVTDQQDDSETSAFWRARDLINKVRGSEIPLFLTQGFLEDNTKPDGAFDFFGNMTGPKRAWFGPWDHVRGNDMAGNRLAMGRTGWFDEVMRFYDEHLKGVKGATKKDPPVAVQNSPSGTWREEAAWPPADATKLTSALKAGSYADDGANNGTGSGAGNGVWTFSPPLKSAAHLAGDPVVHADVEAPVDRANLAANVYDVDAAGKATLVSRIETLTGDGTLDLPMYGNDWTFAAGHRIGVLLSSGNAEWWDAAVPTQSTVTITSARIDLPFLRFKRDGTLPGTPAVKLESYKKSAPFDVSAETIQQGTQPGFAVPDPLKARKRTR